MAARAGPVSVLFITNAPWRKDAPAHVPGEGPDPARLSRELVERGVVVSGRAMNAFPVNPLVRRGTFYAGFDPVRAAAILTRDRRHDVLVSIGESNLAAIVLLARTLRFPPKIVLREVPGRGWARRDRVVDFVLPRVDGVMALTPHEKFLLDRRGDMRGRVDMIGFAVDDQFYRPLPAEDGGYVLAVGDDAGRDYDTLIEAAREASWRLVLRSGRHFAVPPDMADRVTVLGRQSPAALRALYAAASVVAVPSAKVDYASGITALFEGMAMGRAVVASDIGASRSIVRDGENGLLVPSGDARRLRAALDALMTDPARRTLLGAAARASIDGAFSHAAYADRMAASLRCFAAD